MVLSRRNRMKLDKDQYLEIESHASTEIKVGGSRFIGEAHPVRSEVGTQEILSGVRRREYNATHHCWAYRLGEDRSTFRSNDDGEPSGTAGQPMLRQIDACGLTNVLVVVIRYYGGTKLGKGGLARAYGEAAERVLGACRIRERTIRDCLRIKFAYPDTSAAMHTIQQFDAVIEGSQYHDDTELELAIKRSQVDAFKHLFIENLSGRGQLISP